jgi:hypothetical protein
MVARGRNARWTMRKCANPGERLLESGSSARATGSAPGEAEEATTVGSGLVPARR